MRKILFTRPDGGVSIVSVPVDDDKFLDEAKKKLPDTAANVTVVDESILPEDRTFRNAWSYKGGGVSVDMGKAREIQRNKLRALRKPLLEKLDAQYMKADEVCDTQEKQRIMEKKQALRDVTNDPSVLAATTPEELKAALPDILK